MATRMQQRRGTATQWTTANPILNAGEIGFESDTNKFKIGDGTNHWDDLDYFIDETTLGTSLGDYVAVEDLGVANGVATLDGSGKLTSSQVPDIDELAQDAVDAALVAGTGITKTYNDGANTLTLAVDTTVIAEKASPTLTGTTTVDNLTVNGNLNVTGTTVTVNSETLAIKDNMIYLNEPSTATITAASGDGSSVVYTAEGHSFAEGSVVKITGINPSSLNLTSWTEITAVSTDTFTVSSAVTDSYSSGGTATNRVAAEPDLGFSGGYDDGSYKHSGLFRDASDNKWKFYDGYEPEPGLSIDTADGSFAYASLVVNGLEATTSTIGTLTLTNALAIEQGGTGATTQSGAANAVLPSQTSHSGQFLTTDGTDVSWGTVDTQSLEVAIIMQSL